MGIRINEALRCLNKRTCVHKRDTRDAGLTLTAVRTHAGRPHGLQTLEVTAGNWKQTPGHSQQKNRPQARNHTSQQAAWAWKRDPTSQISQPGWQLDFNLLRPSPEDSAKQSWTRSHRNHEINTRRFEPQAWGTWHTTENWCGRTKLRQRQISHSLT